MFNPETVPLRQWPFIFDDKTQRWDVEWNEVAGFLIGCAIIICVIFIIGTLLYTVLSEF